MPDWGDVLRIVVYGASWAGAFALLDRFSARRSRRQMAAGRTVAAARSLTGRAHPVLSPVWSGSASRRTRDGWTSGTR